MATRRIRLSGPGAKGVVVNATLLRDLLDLVIEGSQRALRMRTEGRSTARGALPRWISAATEMAVQILPGSTVLEINAPTLLEADPEEFGQASLFPEVDPGLTGIDYLADSLAAATGSGDGADRFDKPLLELFRGFEGVFDHGISSLKVEGRDRHHRVLLEIQPESIAAMKTIERRIPPPQRVVLAGRLDTIRYSDRTFKLVLPATDESVKGIAVSERELKEYWGKNVVVEGSAHFSADNRVLAVEATRIRSGSDEELQLWALLPEPLGAEVSSTGLRVGQGARTGLNAIVGQWPGDENDDVIEQELERMS